MEVQTPKADSQKMTKGRLILEIFEITLAILAFIFSIASLIMSIRALDITKLQSKYDIIINGDYLDNSKVTYSKFTDLNADEYKNINFYYEVRLDNLSANPISIREVQSEVNYFGDIKIFSHKSLLIFDSDEYPYSYIDLPITLGVGDSFDFFIQMTWPINKDFEDKLNAFHEEGGNDLRSFLRGLAVNGTSLSHGEIAHFQNEDSEFPSFQIINPGEVSLNINIISPQGVYESRDLYIGYP